MAVKNHKASKLDQLTTMVFALRKMGISALRIESVVRAINNKFTGIDAEENIANFKHLLEEEEEEEEEEETPPTRKPGFKYRGPTPEVLKARLKARFKTD